jgi:hypothetical protein
VGFRTIAVVAVEERKNSLRRDRCQADEFEEDSEWMSPEVELMSGSVIEKQVVATCVVGPTGRQYKQSGGVARDCRGCATTHVLS